MAIAPGLSGQGLAPNMGDASGYPRPEESDLQQPAPQQFDLSVDLDDNELMQLGVTIHHEIDRYLQDTNHRRGNAEQWRRDFELYPTGRSTRWLHSADVPAPFVHIYCQSHHTRLNQQIIQAIPPFSAVARKADAQDAAPLIEEALTACLEEAMWARYADEVHGELPQVGNCLLRITYDQKFRRSPRFHFEFDDENFGGMIQDGHPIDAAFLDSFAKDEQGAPDVGLHWENVLVHSGVSFQVIPWEDAVLVPASARSPEELRGIGERIFIRGTELKEGADSGKYLPDAVEAILMQSADAVPQDRSDRLTLQGIAPNPGGETYGTQADPLYRDYLFYELCWQMDANKDGFQEWVIVTLHEKTHRVIRCQYLPYEHGQPYYKLFRYFTRARELLGMGIAEKLAVIQDAATAVLNQLLDHADLILNARANFFYDQTSGFDPNKFILKLGSPIPVDNVDGIKPIPIQEIPAEHYQVYQLLKDMADLITATSNPGLGKATDTSKTLGEVQIVTGMSNMIFEEVAARVSRDWADVADQVRWLYAQYGEGGQVEYRVSAAPGVMIDVNGENTPAASVGGQMQPAPSGVAFGKIKASTLMADVDLVPAGIKQLSDMQSRLQQATIVQNTLLTHPLTSTNDPALKIQLDQFLQAVGSPVREKIMAEVEKFLQAKMAAQQAELAGLFGGGGPQGPNAQGPNAPGPGQANPQAGGAPGKASGEARPGRPGGPPANKPPQGPVAPAGPASGGPKALPETATAQGRIAGPGA